MIGLFFLATQAWAHESYHAAEAAPEIPWSPLFVQCLNFSFLLAVLYFLMRKAVTKHFEHRAREYRELVEKAETARREAESSKLEVERRLANLSASAENAAQEAQAEANLLKSRMAEEARQMAAKLEQEAQRTVAVELEKAKSDLRRELLQQALTSAAESMKRGLNTAEQKKLQNEFADKIQVVRG